MDVVKLLKEAIDQLPSGEYTLGLNATLRHIHSAIRHFERDRAEDPDSFTDAIYRSNQAYEGSLKEAYRVLTGQDPAGLSPFQIEQYLETHSVVRPRVLTQLSRYRQDYRNPSTHDYKLDFDENEALLAILSVAAFAKLLVDQIASKLIFESAKEDIAGNLLKIPTVSGASPDAYFDNLCSGLLSYMNKSSAEGITERENTAMIAAYLTKAGGKVTTDYTTEFRGWTIEWDIVMEIDSDHLIAFDIKSSRGRQSSDITQDRVSRLNQWLGDSQIKYGILVEGAARGDKYIIDKFEFPFGRKVNRLGRKS